MNLQYVYSKCITVDRDTAIKVSELMDKLKGVGSSAGPSGTNR
jgi:hypothetical protein